MTNEELVAEIQAGVNVPDNMAQLYQQNKTFIRKVVYPFSSCCEMDDLMQEAYFGLYKAAQSFRITEGYKFTTYAEWPIRTAIQRYCQRTGQQKKLPPNILHQISQYQKFKSDVMAATGEEPSDQEYCHYIPITLTGLNELRKYMHEMTPVSMDEVLTGTDDFTVGDTIPDEFDLEETVTEQLSRPVGETLLWEAVSDLGDRYSTIIEGQFRKGETLGDLGDQLQISKERVRLLRNRALSALRRSKKVHQAADIYGYGCGQAYHWGIRRFKDTHTSSTEFLAIKHIEQEGHRRNLTDRLENFSSTTKVIANHFQEKEDHYIPIGVQRLMDLNAEVEALFKANLDNKNGKGGGKK